MTRARAGRSRARPVVARSTEPLALPAAPRTVVVGDLNGADDALEEILRGTGLSDAHGAWTGGDAELVQLGDMFNRGPGARAAFERLLWLRGEARRDGGRVTVLLGNHEVMTALRNEAYCTEAEYLSFATERERAEWPARVGLAVRRLYRDHPPSGPIAPLGPRLETWKALHVPGRAALRRALGPRAPLGRAVRSLPVAVQRGETVFVHAGVVAQWARLGLDGLDRATREAWARNPTFIKAVPPRSILRAEDGPLWDRSLALGTGAAAENALGRALKTLGATRMVIGHTATPHVPGGVRGEVLARFGARLVCADVGLASGVGGPRAALVIEGARGYEWSPAGTRALW